MQLRKTIVDISGLPMLQGKSLLECVGEVDIRAALRACIDTITESGRLVDSCDGALENSYMGSKALECIQHEYVIPSLQLIHTIFTHALTRPHSPSRNPLSSPNPITTHTLTQIGLHNT